jgi:adenylate cyclase
MGGGVSACGICGTQPRRAARFCDGCGAAIAVPAATAEYKHVTVLFADVVGSMDLAATLDPERLRDIMSAVFNRSATVVERYGGTVDKFTGDGIMALFGAPIALEDHAFRACLAALDIQNELRALADEVQRRDGIDLRLRIGLDSGQVIAGDIDSGPGGYTAIGVHVGMAQRMESVAPPGGVILSDTTAHLVSHVAVLGEPEPVRIKGSDSPVTAYRLLGTGDPGRHRRHDTTLVGRTWELSALTGILDQAIAGAGAIVGVVGPPGIGKSRIASKLSDLAAHRGVEVFTTYCEAHAGAIPFHAVARLLRAVFGVTGTDPETARSRLRARLDGAAAEDLLLLDDLLGIRDPDTPEPDIDPEARRRRLTSLINTAQLARTTPTVYVIEDAHWIDDVSDAMLAEFVAVTPHTPSLVVITYRPEYHGGLTRLSRSQTIALAPLDDSQTTSLTAELLGDDASVSGLAAQIANRAAGNPFFAEEIVRDLADRGVIEGRRGHYVARGTIADIAVPSTLHATIAARVDRLEPAAKRTLNAAAAIGSRFSADLVARLVDHTDLPALVDAELIDQVMFTPHAEYEFRHPLIRTVAYESQLKSSRADLHQSLATAIELDDPESADENAALIATHYEAADDLHAAYNWHMRAGGWSSFRDLAAATTSWEKARQVADQLSVEDPNRLAMRIAPRTLLCGNAWRTVGTLADTGFDELRELTALAGDKVSLAIGMTGWITGLNYHDRMTEAATLADEFVALLESIGDPALFVALLPGAMLAKFQSGEAAQNEQWATRLIELADGDPTMGNLLIGSPLTLGYAFRALARMFRGDPGFAEDFDTALEIGRPVDTTCYAVTLMFATCCITVGAIVADENATRVADEAVVLAESSDNIGLACALCVRGILLIHRGGADAEIGSDLLQRVREMSGTHRWSMTGVRIADVHLAIRKLQTGDLDGALGLIGPARENALQVGDQFWSCHATTVLVEALVQRGADADLQAADAAVERLQAMPVEPDFVWHEVPLLRMRALLARAHGDDAGYRSYVERYRIRAAECGYVGHVARADEMLAGSKQERE